MVRSGHAEGLLGPRSVNLLLYTSDRMVFGISQKAGLFWILSLDRYEIEWFLSSGLHFILPDFSLMTCFIETSGSAQQSDCIQTQAREWS